MKLLFVILALVALLSSSQGRKCAHGQYNEEIMQRDPSMMEWQRNNEIRMKSRMQQRQESDVYTIPTVVHVVFNPNNAQVQNISDAKILDQIARLNIDFRRLNDLTTTVEDFKDLPIDTKIQFIMADTDPDGNPTTGVTRTITNTNEFESSSNGLTCQRTINGGIDSWNTSRYMNIWICNIGANKLGYAQQPGSSYSPTDGIVINSDAFGYIDYKSTPYNLGRTLTHEVGHWLNLKHTWGNLINECSEDDLVGDTPITDDESYRCNLTRRSCGGVLTMVQNYMDYSDDNCMTLFTPLQAARMRDLFEPVNGFRRYVPIVNYTGTVLGTNGTYVSPFGPLPGPVPNTPTNDSGNKGLSIDDFRSGTYLYILIACAACLGFVLCCAILGSIRRCCRRR